jgi:hypothetical protein
MTDLFTTKLDKIQDIRNQLVLLFSSFANQQFNYENLPEEINEWLIEHMLFYHGKIVFFKVFENYVALPCATSGLLDIYGKPISVFPIALNGQHFPEVAIKDKYNKSMSKIVKKANGVLIKNNETSLPSLAFIMPFIERLIFIWQSLGINESLSRVKYLIRSNKDSANIVKAELGKLLGNKSPLLVISDKRVIMDELEKLDLNVKYEPQNYWYDFDKTFNLILTLCGVENNMESEKKERLIVDEVNSNNQIIDLFNESKFEFRKRAVKKINDMFGLNIEIKKHESDESELLEPSETLDQLEQLKQSETKTDLDT